MGVETKDALLHAINAEFVEAVELLLEHEELIHNEGEPYVSIINFNFRNLAKFKRMLGGSSQQRNLI